MCHRESPSCMCAFTGERRSRASEQNLLLKLTWEIPKPAESFQERDISRQLVRKYLSDSKKETSTAAHLRPLSSELVI